MEINPIKDVWSLYGLQSNPFSTNPIYVKGGDIPLECFIGRNEQIKQLGKIIGSKGGSRTLVYGEVGVGKTSFVNYIRHYAHEKGCFTPFPEIAVRSNWTSDDFVLNTLAAFFTTLRILKTNLISKETYNKLESLVDVVDDTNLTLEVLGIGGGYSKDRKTPTNISSFVLTNFFKEICREIVEKTDCEIIIHYNNLELLPEKMIIELFDNLRDFFQTKGIHFIFVGNLTVKGYFQSISRFTSILTDVPIIIQTLSYPEIRKIIKKRFEMMKIEGLNYNIPFTDDCLRSLFDLWGGNIRHILNSLSTAVQELTEDKPVLIDENLLARTLKSVLEKRYYSRIPPMAKKVLDEIVKREEITNKSLSDILKQKRSNISGYLGVLTREGCVYVRRKTGKDKFWSADPIIKWDLLKEKRTVQKKLPAWL